MFTSVSVVVAMFDIDVLPIMPENTTRNWTVTQQCIKNAVHIHRGHYLLNSGIMFQKLTNPDVTVDAVVLIKAFGKMLPTRCGLYDGIKQCFDSNQRNYAHKIRKKILTKLSKPKEVYMNAVYIMQNINENKGFHKTSTVFYFLNNDETVQYVDLDCHFYNSWDDFLRKNRIDPSLCIYPENGHYGQLQTNGPRFNTDDTVKYVISEAPSVEKRPPKASTDDDNSTDAPINDAYQKFSNLKNNTEIINNGVDGIFATELPPNDKLFLYIICVSKNLPMCIGILSSIISLFNKVDGNGKVSSIDYLTIVMAIYASYGILTTPITALAVFESIKWQYRVARGTATNLTEGNALNLLIAGFEKNLEVKEGVEETGLQRMLIRRIEEVSVLPDQNIPNSVIIRRKDLLRCVNIGDFIHFANTNDLNLNGIDLNNLSDKNTDRLLQIYEDGNQHIEKWKAVDVLAELLNLDNVHMIAGLIEMINYEPNIRSTSTTDLQHLVDLTEGWEKLLEEKLGDRTEAEKVNSHYEKAKAFVENVVKYTDYYQQRYEIQDPVLQNFTQFVETDGSRAAAFEAYGHGLKKYHKNFSNNKKFPPPDMYQWIETYIQHDRDKYFFSIDENAFVRKPL